MIQVAVTANLECAHRSREGVLHGHSYVIEVYRLAGVDLQIFSAEVQAVAHRVDHTLLEDSIGAPSMEAIATWFLQETQAVRVVVRRPTLGYVVEATKTHATDPRQSEIAPRQSKPSSQDQ